MPSMGRLLTPDAKLINIGRPPGPEVYEASETYQLLSNVQQLLNNLKVNSQV